MPDTTALLPALDAALQARRDLITRLAAEQTDAYRLFHGTVEGKPGLTVDRYGSLILVQSFHGALAPAQLDALQAFYASAFPGLDLVYNDRSPSNSRIANPLPADQQPMAESRREFSEMGVKYWVQARHGGQDPWLFLDLRAARRRVMAEAPGKSLLNVFAYTCGVGVAAAKAGARHVVNVDFAESSLAVGKDNAKLNELPIRVRFIKSDAFAALRQLSGIGQPKLVRGKRMPPVSRTRKAQLRPGLPRPAALRQERLRRRRPGPRLPGAVQARPALHRRGRHPGVLQQRRPGRPPGLGRRPRTQREKSRPDDPRDGMDHPRGRLPQPRRQPAPQDPAAEGVSPTNATARWRFALDCSLKPGHKKKNGEARKPRRFDTPAPDKGMAGEGHATGVPLARLTPPAAPHPGPRCPPHRTPFAAALAATSAAWASIIAWRVVGVSRLTRPRAPSR